MIESLAKMPTASLIVLGVFVFVCFLVLVGVFAPQMVDIAKNRMNATKEPSVNNDTLDLIKELLETKIDSLEKRQILTEKQIEKTQSSIEGLVKKIDDGFRYLSSRLDEHIVSDKKIQP